MKEEALKLADELDALHQYVPSEAPAMIRRLVEELDKQEYRNKHEGFSTIIDKVAPQKKPLSDEEIEKEALKDKYWDWEDFDFMKFAKAIEERHGIK